MNVTIDDTGGDSVTGAKPSYTASGNAYTWRGRPSQDPCPLCAANLDTTQTHLGTWHDGTCDEGGISTVSFSFSGSAVYVYAVLPNAVPGNSATHLAFHIDGSLVGTFTRQPNTSISAPAYVYNQLVYANISLGWGGDSGVERARDFLIVNGGGADASLFLFDYATYTRRSDGTTSGSTTASEISETSAFPSAERSPVASASSKILNMDITSSTSASHRAQSSSVLSVATTNIPTDAPDTPLAEASESSNRTDDHSSRTTSIVIATTTATVTIIVIVLIICIVRRRRRRRRSRLAAKVAELEERMAQVHEAVVLLGSHREVGNREVAEVLRADPETVVLESK